MSNPSYTQQSKEEIMKFIFNSSRKKDYFIYAIIFLSLFLALLPAILSNNYLRQDDLKIGIWWGMKISDEGHLYYNTVFQIVRPVCMLIFYLIDLISIDMHYAIYVRLLSIITVGILAILLYNWQRIFNSNKMLATTFAIASFTLPGIQLFTATANYFLIIFGLLSTLGAAFYWYNAHIELSSSKKRKYNFIACSLFMISLLDYPLASMYVWVLAAICYLNTLRLTPSSLKRTFFNYLVRKSLYMMLAYFVLIKLVHWIFHVHLDQLSAVINYSHFASKLLQPVIMFILQADFWFYTPDIGQDYYLPITFISLSCIAALAQIHFLNGNRNFLILAKKSLINFGAILILFVLAYSPILALPEFSYTFRYTIATMPMLLYLFFWSVSENCFSKISKSICNLFLIALASFGVCYANLMIGDGIVGPYTNDFNFLEQQLTTKALPYLNKHQKLAIHVIDCDHGANYQFAKGVPTTLEYNMRLCAFPIHLIGAINHSLMSLGYISNFHKANKIVTENNEMIVSDVPWGYMVLSSSKKLTYQEPDTKVITIDMRDVPAYQHLDFYKSLFKKNK